MNISSPKTASYDRKSKVSYDSKMKNGSNLRQSVEKLGRKALGAIATIVKPDTILRWHANLVARKFDGSSYRRTTRRPTISEEIEILVLRIARENKTWGARPGDMTISPAL